MVLRDFLTLILMGLIVLLALIIFLALTPDNPISGYRPRIELSLNQGATTLNFALNDSAPVTFSGRIYETRPTKGYDAQMGFLSSLLLLKEGAWPTFISVYKRNPKLCPGRFLSKNTQLYPTFAGDEYLRQVFNGFRLTQGDQVSVTAFDVELLEGSLQHGKLKLGTFNDKLYLATEVVVNGSRYRVAREPVAKTAALAHPGQPSALLWARPQGAQSMSVGSSQS